MNETVIFGAFASALNLDANEFTAALKDGDNWLEGEALAEKIKELASNQHKAAKEAQYKRGVREMGSTLEKKMKAAGFSNDEKLQGAELVDAFVSFQQAQATPTGDPTQLTPDKLAALPAVKELIQKAKLTAGQELETLKAQYEAEKKNWHTTRVKDVTGRKLGEWLEEAKINLDLPNSPVSKTARINAISAMVDFSKIGLSPDGEPLMLDADGNPATDDYGKPVELKKHVIGLGTELYGVRTQDPNRSGGNPPAGAPGAAGEKYTPTYNFKDATEYNNFMMKETDPKVRSTAAKDWELKLTSKEAAG